MRLLVITDHRHWRTPEGVYDTYCFDRAFFDDYRAVFASVTVAARMRRDAPPATARRSDGDGVTFLDLPDIQGARWMLTPTRVLLPGLAAAVRSHDAVVARLPGRASQAAAALALRHGKPLMLEIIGDASASLGLRSHGLARWLIGQRNAHAVRRIAARAQVASYVSERHLQARYPVAPGVPTAAISSIRLDPDTLTPPRAWPRDPSPLRLVLTASLVPVKNHAFLLAALAALDGLGRRSWTLDLLGDGPCRPALEAQARALGLTDRVVFHGHVSDRSVITASLDIADCFVMSSDSEGLPRAMLEAFARGLPAVGTRVGGIAELLPAADTVAPGDVAGFAALLARAGDAGWLTQHSLRALATARDYVGPVLSARRRRLLAALAALVPAPTIA